MYSDVVHRSQIYLDDQELALLAEAARRTGASRSELLRRAVRAQYGRSAPERRLASLRVSAGTWRERLGTGADYVDGLRAGLAERLEQVGLG
jgi:Arc/MetJ family transcription regulator